MPAKNVLPIKTKVPNQTEAATVGKLKKRILRESAEFATLVRNTNTDIVFKDEEKTGADLLMSPRLKTKLDTLAELVKKEWAGVRLRVTEAWDEDVEHHLASAHYEGRAADLTTSDVDQSKLGRLAALAVDAGLDWVFYENKFHVHVSVKRD
jgi:hypothetical protein